MLNAGARVGRLESGMDQLQVAQARRELSEFVRYIGLDPSRQEGRLGASTPNWIEVWPRLRRIFCKSFDGIMATADEETILHEVAERQEIGVEEIRADEELLDALRAWRDKARRRRDEEEQRDSMRL